MMAPFIVLFGLLPSLLLFIWVERNTALPGIGSYLIEHGVGVPWVYLEGGLGWGIAFNLGLIAIFGVLHSGLAGRKSVSRSVYVIFSGLASLLIMLFWQPTGIIIYQLIPSAVFSSVVSLILYWGFLALAMKSLVGIDGPASFVGLIAPKEETESAKVAQLQTTGIYARVRHPAYLFTIAAWFITPMMGLDRLIFCLGMLGYLAIGVRFEEKRLIEKFGEAYREYQKRTPMLFPRILKVRSTESIP